MRSEFILSFFCLIHLTWWSVDSSIFAQQYASVNFNTYSPDSFSRLIEESSLYEGILNDSLLMLTENFSGEGVQMDIEVQSDLSNLDSVLFRLGDLLVIDTYGYVWQGDSLFIEDGAGRLFLSSSVEEGDKFSILCCGHSIFYLYMNKMVGCRFIGGEPEQVNGEVRVKKADNLKVDVTMGELDVCELSCKGIEQRAIVLERFMEWREHVFTDTTLDIYFVERYSVKDTEFENVQLELYDNGGELLYMSDVEHRYGYNVISWPLPSSLLTDQAKYVLKVIGINKDENYAVRLRYIAP